MHLANDPRVRARVRYYRFRGRPRAGDDASAVRTSTKPAQAELPALGAALDEQALAAHRGGQQDAFFNDMRSRRRFRRRAPPNVMTGTNAISDGAFTNSSAADGDSEHRQQRHHPELDDPQPPAPLGRTGHAALSSARSRGARHPRPDPRLGDGRAVRLLAKAGTMRSASRRSSSCAINARSAPRSGSSTTSAAARRRSRRCSPTTMAARSRRRRCSASCTSTATKPKIQRYGFSLLGHEALTSHRWASTRTAFEVTLDKLSEVRVPAIALVRRERLQPLRRHSKACGTARCSSAIHHPAAASSCAPISERIWFEKILFVVRNHTSLPGSTFRISGAYACPAPLGTENMHRAGLADPTLMKQGPNDF